MYTFISLIDLSICASLVGKDLILLALISTFVRFGSLDSLLSSSSKFSEASGLPQILSLRVSKKSNLSSALEILSSVLSSSSVLVREGYSVRLSFSSLRVLYFSSKTTSACFSSFSR